MVARRRHLGIVSLSQTRDVHVLGSLASHCQCRNPRESADCQLTNAAEQKMNP